MTSNSQTAFTATIGLCVSMLAVAGEGDTRGKGHVPIVYNGKPRAIVVVAENPTRPAHVAAKELIHYVKKITGVELQLHVDGAAPSKSRAPRRVLVGESTMTREHGLRNADFELQEYLIETRGQDLILMGRDAEEYGLISHEKNGLWPTAGRLKSKVVFTPMGSLYAVHTFLEKYCGVRWYLPGEIGEVCPRSDKLVARNLHLRTKPWTRYRWASRTNQPDPFGFYEGQTKYKPKRMPFRDMILWLVRMKIGGSSYCVNHSFYGYHKRFGKTHPEWWPDNSPRRGVHLDYLHPGVIAQAARDAADYFDGKYPDGKYEDGSWIPAAGDYFAVMPLDTSTGWVKTEKARALLREPGPGDPKAPGAGFFCGWASDYVFSAVNEAAKLVHKKHPDKWITCTAYAPYYLPPREVKLSPNVSVCVTGCVNSCAHPEDRRYFFDTLKEWGELVGELYVWEYYLQAAFGNFRVFPAIFPKRVAEGLTHMRACGVRGMFFEPSGSPGLLANPAEDLLNHYVTWKYLCDQSLPIDKLLNEHYRLFYGPAEKPMREFFTLIEQRWADPTVAQTRASKHRKSWQVRCPPEVLAQIGKPIQQALAMDLDEPYRSRVKLMHEAIYARMERNSAAFQERSRTKRRIACPVARVAPKIDGDLSDPAWSHAATTEPFVDVNNRKPVSVSTVAKIMRDRENLYFAAVCPEPTMEKLKTEITEFDDIRIAGDCEIEVFIDVGQTQEKYYHLLFSTVPNMADRGVKMGYKRHGLEWDSDARYAVRKRVGGYDVEVAIPLKSIGAADIRPGDVWGLNFGRCRGFLWHQGKEPRWSCWSPTYGGFNNPDEFGEMVME